MPRARCRKRRCSACATWSWWTSAARRGKFERRDGVGRTIYLIMGPRDDAIHVGTPRPRRLPCLRCPPTGHHSQTMQPLQDALLRAGLPETTLMAMILQKD